MPTSTRISIVLCLGLASASPALARPEAPPIVCETYPDAAVCAGQLPACSTCHTSTWPAAWNEFGQDILGSLTGPLEETLPAALAALADGDSDRDGVGNLDELFAGTSPGDAKDVWTFCVAEPLAQSKSVPVAERYDFDLAYRRAMILYCGQSPTYDEMTAFRALGDDRAASYSALHDAVSACLDGLYWRDEALPRLADRRIRPVSAVGADSLVGITIADYDWDYRLFSYVMTGDRDVRDLLLADYHVEQSQGELVPSPSAFPEPLDRPGGQPLDLARRAGMITTQWFLAINTMFSAMPRTTAAQAYRAYLGYDIAKQEGLYPIPNEPADVDGRGVAQAECAVCHSTLDPLSYAFASYEGIVGSETGTYDPGRPSRVIPGWADNQAMLFGEPVSSVRAWAETAAASDAFKRDVVSSLFRHALERDPSPGEVLEFEAIWRALPEDGYSANRAIHRIVDTRAFGVR